MKKRIALLLVVALLLCSVGFVPAYAGTVASANTTLDGSNKAKKNNIDQAISCLDGIEVCYGDYFSFNDNVGERTADNGYQNAVNGRGAKVMGGGVSQVAATLYLALKRLDGIDYVDKQVYGSKFTDTYLSDGKNAIVTDYKNGIDFSFYNYYGDFTIEMWRDSSYVYCTLTSSSSSGGSSYSGDEVGYASIYIDGTYALCNNIELAAESIGCYTMEHNDYFSFNTVVGPRTEDYGYEKAINGRGVKVVGGGVAQVASVIWLAIKDMDCIVIEEKSTYDSRYNQDYVTSSRDAIVTDYNNNVDFAFSYTGYGTLDLNVYVDDGELICDVYEY